MGFLNVSFWCLNGISLLLTFTIMVPFGILDVLMVEMTRENFDHCLCLDPVVTGRQRKGRKIPFLLH